MIFKSQSTQPLVKAVRETFDQFDLELQPDLKIFCGDDSELQVARSLLLTSSSLLRSFS